MGFPRYIGLLAPVVPQGLEPARAVDARAVVNAGSESRAHDRRFICDPRMP